MAIDLKKIDAKKFGIIFIAVVSGLVAVALTGKYIDQEVSKAPDPEIIDRLSQQIRQIDQNTRVLQERQQAVAQQVEARVSSLIKEFQARPAVEPPKPEQRLPVTSLVPVMPPDKRAVTLRINTLLAVGGLLNPGDRVDILAHLNTPAQEEAQRQEKRTTVTLFQNIQILAIGPNVGPGDFETQQKTSNLIITFAVDPRQAELLTFAEKNGYLQLVLRSPQEKGVYRLGPTTWEALNDYLRETQNVGIDRPVDRIEKPRETKEPDIQVIRGGQPVR